ncbi:diguanylate cyclase [Pseudoneobacillus sp. C159]
MYQVIQSSLSNIAIIFFMQLCIIILLNRRERFPDYYFPISLIMLVSTTVIIIFYLPIEFEGFKFDLRLVPLVFLAIRWGFPMAFPALLVTGAWRLAMGGVGAIPGVIFGMVLPVLFTLLIQRWKSLKVSPLSLLYLFTASWLISDLPAIFWISDGWSVFKEMAIIRFSSITLTGLSLFLFLFHSEKELKLKKKLQFHANHDPLTGLFNMSYFYNRMKTYDPADKKMYIAMIDIDYFKTINDTYGHLNGDHILRKVAATIKMSLSHLNKNDYVLGRYGGEEFILFLAVDSLGEMKQTVSAILQKVERTLFHTKDGDQEIHLTVSIGVAELNHYAMLNEIIEQADNGLYSSKESGRNRIFYAH